MLQVRVSPGEHCPSPWHADNDHAPFTQVLVCVPQFPHDCVGGEPEQVGGSGEGPGSGGAESVPIGVS